MKTKEYAQQIMQENGLKSGYALSKFLGINQQTGINWLKNNHTISDNHAINVAKILGLPEALVLADMSAERAEKIGKMDIAAVWHAVAEGIRSGTCALPQTPLKKGGSDKMTPTGGGGSGGGEMPEINALSNPAPRGNVFQLSSNKHDNNIYYTHHGILRPFEPKSDNNPYLSTGISRKAA